MPTLSQNIKAGVKTILDALKTAGTLGYVIEDDFRKDPLNRDMPAFPCAILTTPSISSDFETNRENLRTYTYEVLVFCKGEDVTSADQVEGIIDAILNAFDNDPTLAGAANGEVQPSASTPEAITTGDKSYVVFVVTLACKALYMRT